MRICEISGFCLAVTVLMLSGCGKPSHDFGTRLKTVPVTGEVYVDGNPAAGIFVRAPTEGPAPKPDKKIDRGGSFAVTDEAGKFAMHTYAEKDGLPEGDYALTFVWPNGEITGMESSTLKAKEKDKEDKSAYDRFHGRYKKPQDSPKKIKVERGRALDVGRIELTTQ